MEQAIREQPKASNSAILCLIFYQMSLFSSNISLSSEINYIRPVASCVNISIERSSSVPDDFPEPVIEGNDLCGADKGEVKRVEEEHHILARIVGEADLHERYISGRNHILKY